MEISESEWIKIQKRLIRYGYNRGLKYEDAKDYAQDVIVFMLTGNRLQNMENYNHFYFWLFHFWVRNVFVQFQKKNKEMRLVEADSIIDYEERVSYCMERGFERKYAELFVRTEETIKRYFIFNKSEIPIEDI